MLRKRWKNMKKDQIGVLQAANDTGVEFDDILLIAESLFP